jgi:hypothetical protein
MCNRSSEYIDSWLGVPNKYSRLEKKKKREQEKESSRSSEVPTLATAHLACC